VQSFDKVDWSGRLTGAAEIVWSKVIGRLVVKVIDEPTVTQRAESDECDVEFFACVDQTASLVHCFEGGVLCLHCVDFGDYRTPVSELAVMDREENSWEGGTDLSWLSSEWRLNILTGR